MRALLIAFMLLGFSLTLTKAQTLNLTGERVLIVNQLADDQWRSVGEGRASIIERLILHFTPNVKLVETSAYRSGTLVDFTKIFVIGNSFETTLPKHLLEDLLRTTVPIVWMGYNVEQLLNLPDAGFQIVAGQVREKPGERISVAYHNQKWATNINSYTNIQLLSREARVWSTLHMNQDLVPVPFILNNRNLWFVNALLDVDDDYPNPLSDAPILIFSDLLHEIFETKIGKEQRAVIRLEDVSTHVNPVKLKSVVEYLRDKRVPYAVGLIPNQRQQDGSISPLRDHIELVEVLRFAQQNGGTIALHGYHHTFGTGEDYEFWDADQDRPLPNETRELYACKVKDGIELLRDLGLEPRLWETPHYAASPLGYKTFGEYFSHAIENRGWRSPYPYGPDRFGQIIIPENLGYIHPASGWTVEKQLARARMLRIVRDSWSVGFYHPVTIPILELDALVTGLRGQGLNFVDLRTVPMKVHSTYQLSSPVGGTFSWNWRILGQMASWLASKWTAVSGAARRETTVARGPCDRPNITVDAISGSTR